MMKKTLKRTLAICGLLTTDAFVVPVRPQNPLQRGAKRSELNLFSPLLAGAVSGAVGVGVAFPLDTLKTKQQVQSSSSSSSSTTTIAEMNPDGRISTYQRPVTMVDVFQETWNKEGLGGFFGGVQTSMLGQAVIKSVAFGINSYMLSQLSSTLDANSALLLAAATAGFVTAFLAVPCDRIKVLMQCKDGQCQCNDWDCLSGVIAHEGLYGLFFRGLGPTLCREVPAYTIYFSVYGALLAQAAGPLGAAAPLVCGAVAGATCVLPVYPVDVVKTLVQNTRGGDESSSDTNCWEVAKSLYERQGMAGFWDGLTPRMLRAAVNHAVTFATYEWIIQL